ncbi:MAG: hypothetical protein HYX47_04015 [Burkholderiales bacterium]|nr:hypothetical protein [Burkholderiales bacterium]
MRFFALALRIALTCAVFLVASNATAQSSPPLRKVYPNTSLTACPAGEKLEYFYYYQDTPDFRGPDWCAAAQADLTWANANDPNRWRIPYLMDSCVPGVGWYYSHAFQDGTRYHSPINRDVNMVCTAAAMVIAVSVDKSSLMLNERTRVVATVVKSDGQPGSGVSVSVGGSRLGTLAGCAGITDGAGMLQCAYQAGMTPGSDTLTGTCDGCTSPGTAGVTVLPPPPVNDGNSCSRKVLEEGNPITPATGEKTQVETDFQDIAAHPLNWVRNFRSTWATGSPRAGLLDAGLGKVWSHNHAISLTLRDGLAMINTGEGDAYVFSQQVVGGQTAWVSSSGPDRLVQSGAGYLFVSSQDDSQWQFDAGGRLLTVTQRNGWVMSYTYNAGRLVQVRNQFGRALSLAYDVAGRLASVTAPDGQTFRYAYDANAALTQVIYADNTSRGYVYENGTYPMALTGVVDENGRRFASFAYDGQGRGLSTEHAGGVERYEVSYDPNGGSAVVTDPLGTARTKRYAAQQGKLTVVDSDVPAADGPAIRSREQSSDGLLSSETDYLGIKTFYTWDATRQLRTGVTAAAGLPEAQTVNTTWHSQWRLPVQIDEAGRRTLYEYDSQANLTRRTVTDTALGISRSWSYGWTNGLMISSTDPLGRQAGFQYDAAGNLTKSTNALGHVTQFAYDTAGRVKTLATPAGAVANYLYDARNRLVSRAVVPAGGGAAETDSFSYTPSGQLARAVSASGFALDYTYDTAQRLVGVRDTFGNTAAYVLDGMGNRTRTEMRDALGNLAFTQTRFMNAINRVEYVVGARDQTTQFMFDANGEAVTVSDPNARRTETVLDGLKRPVGQRFDDGAATSLTYNALDQTTAATDPKGVRTAYTVDALGNVRVQASPDTGASNAQFDAAGNLTSATNALNQTTQYRYDALNRLLQITWSDAQSSRFTYDGGANAKGKLTRIEDAEGTTDYNYDGFGRVAAKTQTLKNGMTQTVRYTYAPGGQVASITYPSGKVVSYAQQAGRVTGISIGGTPFVSNVVYSALNAAKGWNWANGDSASRSFDTDGRMAANEFATYTFDRAGNIVGIQQQLYMPNSTSTFALGVASYQIEYDSRNRISRMNRDFRERIVPELMPMKQNAAPVLDTDNPNAPTARFGELETFEYDLNGNRTSRLEQLRLINPNTGNMGAGLATQRSYNLDGSSNRLLGLSQTLTQTNARGNTLNSASSTVNYGLDAAGDQTGDGLKSYEYDAAGRLAKLSYGIGDARQSVVYLHNGLGQRIFKSEPLADQASPDPAVLGQSFVEWLQSRFAWLFTTTRKNDKTKLGTAFLYAEDGSLLGEYGAGGNKSTGTTEHIYLPTEQGNVLVGAIINGDVYAVHTDHLNTPRLMTDAANQPVWQWRYSAFGDNEPSIAARNFKDRSWAFAKGDLKDQADGSDDADNGPQFGRKMVKLNVRYPGQYFDDESNLHYNGYRTYSSLTGRYTQPDSIGLAGGWNRFAYVGGNPLIRTDPKGESWSIVRTILLICGKEVIRWVRQWVAEDEAITQNKIAENRSNHIFRDADGHIPDTPANRSLLEEVANDPKSSLGTDKWGNNWSARTQSDGTQVWTQTRSGEVINGGVNPQPKVFNPTTGLSRP